MSVDVTAVSTETRALLGTRRDLRRTEKTGLQGYSDRRRSFYLATENFNQGVELSVNITAGIFLKATGSQKQSKQHNYIIKSKTIYMSLQDTNTGDTV